MLRSIVLPAALLFVVISATSASAQAVGPDGLSAPSQTAEQKPAVPVPAAPSKTSPPTPDELAAPRPPAQLANIRLELTISDQRGTAPPSTKTVSMVVADRGLGRIRTGADVKTPEGFRPVTLNVDAQPEFLRDGRVRVVITLEYRPVATEGSETAPIAGSNISETMNVILSDGTPLTVSQSADPHTDRKVRVELKGTILK
jgi:hypothetical protein